MTPRSDLLQLLVHPHQIEVQEFESYDVIVDLRDPAEYLHDHIPGAVNVPWSGPLWESVCTNGSAPPAMRTASDVPASGSYALHARLASLGVDAAVLLYSGEGGGDSAEAARAVAHLGLTADVLAGGWATYRVWVTEGLRILGACLHPRWIRSEPCGLSQAVLEVLRERGEQVCGFSSIVGQGVLPGLWVHGAGLMSQDAFDTRLLDVLRRHDPARTVWYDEVHRLGGAYRLPGELMARLGRSVALRPTAPLEARVALVRRHVESLQSEQGLAELLGPCLAMVEPELAGEVRRLLSTGEVDRSLAALLSEGTDLLVDEESGDGPRQDLIMDLGAIDPPTIARALLAAVPELQGLPPGT